MSRRLAPLTLDNLADLPDPCRSCVVWELDPVAARRAAEAGDTGFEKESWVSATLLEWGSCGRIAYVDDEPAGFVTYAPPQFVPAAAVVPDLAGERRRRAADDRPRAAEFAGGGLARMLVQGAAKDLTRRGVRAIEAFGATPAERPIGADPAATCVLPGAGRPAARGRLQDRPAAPPLPAAAAGAEDGAVVARGRRARAGAASSAPCGRPRSPSG